MDKAAVDYIKKTRAKGFSDEQIKKSLLATGRPEALIEQCLTEASKKDAVSSQKTAEQQSKQKDSSSQAKSTPTSPLTGKASISKGIESGKNTAEQPDKPKQKNTEKVPSSGDSPVQDKTGMQEVKNAVSSMQGDNTQKNTGKEPQTSTQGKQGLPGQEPLGTKAENQDKTAGSKDSFVKKDGSYDEKGTSQEKGKISRKEDKQSQESKQSAPISPGNISSADKKNEMSTSTFISIIIIMILVTSLTVYIILASRGVVSDTPIVFAEDVIDDFMQNFRTVKDNLPEGNDFEQTKDIVDEYSQENESLDEDVNA